VGRPLIAPERLILRANLDVAAQKGARFTQREMDFDDDGRAGS
jgi:hypothetical protein